MDCNKISIDQTNILSSLAADYVSSNKLNAFISYPPTMDGIKQSIEQKKYHVDRKLIAEELTKQNTSKHAKVLHNLDLISQENTFTVTTGHQICLFTGPLYSIYKIVSTISLAEELTLKFPEKQFVPIFWMATEDHDKEEINHIHLFNKKLSWETNQKGAVGDFSLNDLTFFLEELVPYFNNQPELIKSFISIYKESKTLAEAHRKLIHFLFEKYGLLVVDGNSTSLKKLMIPFFEDELLNQKSSELIKQQTDKLIQAGYKEQITPREINLFYLSPQSRERIVLENAVYKVLNTQITFTKEELLTELHQFPEKFSPNVALRPLYQEFILPNIATIGGPGEIAYWLQLKSVFDYFRISFPVLILRDSALFIRKSIQQKIASNNLSYADLFRPVDIIVNEKIIESSEISFEKEISELSKIFEIAKEKAVRIDTSLEKTVIGELTKAQNSMNMILSKTIKAEKRNNDIAVNQIKSIYDSVFPNGVFQERHDNFLAYYYQEFIDNLIANFNPLDNQLKIYTL